MRRYAILLGIALAMIAADQATKYLAVRDLTRVFSRAGAETLPARVAVFYGEEGLAHLRRAPVDVIPGFWTHRYAENPGAAFSLLQNANPTWRRIFFLVVTLVAAAFVLVMVRRLADGQHLATAALGLVLGGAMGNFIDRMARGYVIDFIDWHLQGHPRLHWPTFNIADAGITLGVTVLVVQVVRETLAARRMRDT